MKILFIGGTGIISHGCTEIALERGHEVWHLRRGKTGNGLPGVKWLQGDIRQMSPDLLRGQTFDAVVDFMAFVPDHIDTDWRFFHQITGHYVFISSASCYAKPVPAWPITEKTPLSNPFWKYSRDKIACEQKVLGYFQENAFPATIVRPSHTYGFGPFPMDGGYTYIDRLKKGKKIIVHGDGTSLWTLTHARDFAVGLLGILGKPQTFGEAYHITSDEFLTWNRIFEILAGHLGVEPKIVHMPSDWIAQASESWGASLLGDKAHCAVFDNAKIKALVPEYEAQTSFAQGAPDILRWYDADTRREVVDFEFDRISDHLVSCLESLRLQPATRG